MEYTVALPHDLEDKMAKNKIKLPLTEGPIFWRIILFALPIIATGVLQVLYNMADNIVVGRFSGDPTALGSVGSTTSLTNLILNMLLGIAVGTSVVVSQAYGAKSDKTVSRAVHTALTFSIIGGLVLMAIGLAISRPALVLMKTQPEMLEGAVLYFRIICIGIPASAVYNFGAAILRSIGDSKTPLIILSSTGLVNVGLNFFFVLACKMSVAGVAIATIVSQYLSAILVIVVLWSKKGESYCFSPKRLCIDFEILKRILRFGIPSGIQSSLFSISNVLLTSGINSLSNPYIVTAYTVSNNIDAITFISCNSFHQAALTFTGQNFGAKKHDRIKRVVIYSLLQVAFFGIVIAQTELLFSDQLASLYISSTDPGKEQILAFTRDILLVLLNTYFICGIMDVLSGILKGLGYSLVPMIISLVGICGIRIAWVSFVFPLEQFNSHVGLCLSYPISWSLTICMLLPTVIVALRRLNRQRKSEAKENDSTKELV